MQIATTNYYDTTKFSNTLYLIQIAIETFFSHNLFKSDVSRVIYASEEYAFRQRLNLLSKNATPTIQEIQLPFMNYFRHGNWRIDDRFALPNATAAMVGYNEDVLGGLKMRFLSAQTSFDCVVWMNSDLDAQMAHESLLWIQQPSPKQLAFDGMQYENYEFSIPVHITIDSIDFNPAYTERQWLISNRVFPIKFGMTVRSGVLSQLPQDSNSDLYWSQQPVTITKHVLLDFLSYKFKNSFYDQQHITQEVDGIFTADPLLNGTFQVVSFTDTTLTVQWGYNPAAVPLYNPNVTISVDLGEIGYVVPLVSNTYTITGLTPDSLYNLEIWFTSTSGQLTIYKTTGSTTSINSAPITIPGLIGYN